MMKKWNWKKIKAIFKKFETIGLIMKKYQAQIKVTLRKSILDVQGKAVENSLHSLGFDLVENVRIGKLIDLEVTAQNDGQANALIEKACKTLLTNPIVEDYSIAILNNDDEAN